MRSSRFILFLGSPTLYEFLRRLWAHQHPKKDKHIKVEASHGMQLKQDPVKIRKVQNTPTGARTLDLGVISTTLYQLSYRS